MFNPSNYLGCIPLSEFKSSPKDQPGCEIEDCPECKKGMWVSKRKRELRDNKNMKTICWFCLLNLCIKNGIDPREVEIFDMTKSN